MGKGERGKASVTLDNNVIKTTYGGGGRGQKKMKENCILLVL